MKKSKNFWKELDKPLMLLAPLSGVTDTAFRRLIAKYGKPDICYTEFVSCHGLCSKGREKLLPDLWYDESERPVLAQIFGSNPDHFKEAAAFCAELGFDGIDINTGCPDKNVEKQGAGSALMKDPDRLKAIIRATKEGAGDLPVSVKTRLGYDSIIIDELLCHMLEEDPVSVTIHLRTRQEMSKVPARWEEIGNAVKTRDRLGSDALILGNGDVKNTAQARELCTQYGADGWMIGRGIFGNPWLFNDDVERDELPVETRLKVMLEHTKLFHDILGDIKNFAIMRKHYKAYVAGFPEAKSLREKLMETTSYHEVKNIVEDYLGAKCDIA